MKLWALLALAASVVAIPLQDHAVGLHKRNEARNHIGYRALSQAEAEAINKNGGKAVQSNGSGAKQLGPGLYITRGFQEWNPKNDDEDKEDDQWDCVVTADAAWWKGRKKAWVPKSFEFPEDKEKNPDQCRPLMLWAFRNRNNRERFLKYLDQDSTPDNTVRFAVIASHEWLIQALVPPDIVAEGEIYLSQCAKRKTDASEQLGKMGYANWELDSMPGWGLGPDV